MFTNYHVLRIYQNTIRMFFMLVLCQSGMGVILIITALVVLCFGFVSKAGLTMFGLLSSACTASRLSLFPTLCPSVSGRKGSGQGCGCLAVGPGHPTRVQSLRETESQLHWVLGVAACAKDDHPVWYWKVQTCSIQGWVVCFFKIFLLAALEEDVKFTFFCLQRPICDCHTLSEVEKKKTAVPALLNAPHQVFHAGLSDP